MNTMKKCSEFFDKFGCKDTDQQVKRVKRRLLYLLGNIEFNTDPHDGSFLEVMGDAMYDMVNLCNLMGVCPKELLKEIHRSNMTKKPGSEQEDGSFIIDDDYSSPDFEKVFRKS